MNTPAARQINAMSEAQIPDATQRARSKPLACLLSRR
jgi:hypothetical protein